MSAHRSATRRGRRVIGALLLVSALTVLLLARCDPTSTPEVVHVAAVGDMACAPGDPSFADGRGTGQACRQLETSALLNGHRLSALLGLGDYQYESPTGAGMAKSYDPSYGRFKKITRPALGNQEYRVHGANLYYSYFAMTLHKGRDYYSYDLGRWHLIVLDSNCDLAGGCGPRSPQLRWLRRDLADDHHKCTLAYWHHPRFSSGLHGADTRSRYFWEALYAAHADLVLNAHEHDYERFVPVSPSGNYSPDGVQEFVVGAGGQDHYLPVSDAAHHAVGRRSVTSAARSFDTFGVLFLTLSPETYSWTYQVVSRSRPIDEGTRRCQ